jgi:hypothetical protein
MDTITYFQTRSMRQAIKTAFRRRAGKRIIVLLHLQKLDLLVRGRSGVQETRVSDLWGYVCVAM